MHTLEQDHDPAAYYAITGHRPSPVMQFPSLGSVIAKELSRRNGLPAYVLEPQWERNRVMEDYFKAGFLGSEYNPMIVPDPNDKSFQVPDLSLSKPFSIERLRDRQLLLKIVDRFFRRTEEMAQYASLDTFTEQALQMILSPDVRRAFDLSQEPQSLKEAYGVNGFGQSASPRPPHPHQNASYLNRRWPSNSLTASIMATMLARGVRA